MIIDADAPATVTSRGALGSIMLAVAAVGLVVAAVGTVVAWQLVGRLNESSRESLDVAIETLDTVDATVLLAGDVLGTVDSTLTTTSETLQTVSSSFSDASGVIDEIDDLTEIVGPALGEATSTLRQLELVGRNIDGILEGVDDLPLVPDYDAGDGLGASIGSLAEQLEPLPASFAQTSADLDDFGVSIGELRSDVDELVEDIGDVSIELSAADALVGEYRRSVASARNVAVDTRDGLNNDVGLIRVVIVIGGLHLGLAQIVPWWLSRQLRFVREPVVAPDPDDLDA